MKSFRISYVILALLFFSLDAFVIAGEPNKALMQGVWFGDGIHPLNRYVLIIDDNDFVLITPLGSFKSTFDVNDQGNLNGIDIDRYDGDRQLGLYKIDKTKIYLKFADPSKPRPTTADVTFSSGKPHWHTIFDRKPTPEGLEVLQKHFTESTDISLTSNQILP